MSNVPEDPINGLDTISGTEGAPELAKLLRLLDETCSAVAFLRSQRESPHSTPNDSIPSQIPLFAQLGCGLAPLVRNVDELYFNIRFVFLKRVLENLGMKVISARRDHNERMNGKLAFDVNIADLLREEPRPSLKTIDEVLSESCDTRYSTFEVKKMQKVLEIIDTGDKEFKWDSEKERREQISLRILVGALEIHISVTKITLIIKKKAEELRLALEPLDAAYNIHTEFQIVSPRSNDELMVTISLHFPDEPDRSDVIPHNETTKEQ